jgi:hypothetical protein
MKTSRLFVPLAFTLFAAACSSSTTTSPPPVTHPGVNGIVESGPHPIAGATVTLYQMGHAGTGTGATVVGHAVTSASGTFFVRFPGAAIQTGLYLVAEGGNAGAGPNPAIVLAGLVDMPGSSTVSTINERTTVAFAAALEQFSDAGGTIVGTTATNAQGLRNAALLDLKRLVNAGTGAAASFFPSEKSCTGANPAANCEGLERMNGLANAVAACTRSAGSSSAACTALMNATGTRSKTTLAALHALVADPSRSADAIYVLAKSNATYVPSVGAPPTNWMIGLRHFGNGKEFDGPGNFAIDGLGNIWIGNNYAYNADPHIPACGGKIAIELTPLGDDAPGAPFTGGGIDGVGWGVTVDHAGNVWVGNFGFQGKGCTVAPQDQTVSKLAPDGTPLSPDTGFKQGPIDRPQGVVTDAANNLWMANFGNGSVTVYRNADPSKSAVYDIGLTHAFGEAIDATDRIWVTGEGSDNVALLNNDGTPVAGSPFHDGITRPLGDTVDMENDVWVSSNGSKSVVVLDSNGHPILGSPITGGGIDLPWGVAVDGNDNVWVADFYGAVPRVSQICGRRGLCPRGLKPGAPISPTTGYQSDLLERLTGVAIDASGNVWVCDNWRRVPFQTNPGGDSVVEYVGVAGPVGWPSYGPAHRP